MNGPEYRDTTPEETFEELAQRIEVEITAAMEEGSLGNLIKVYLTVHQSNQQLAHQINEITANLQLYVDNNDAINKNLISYYAIQIAAIIKSIALKDIKNTFPTSLNNLPDNIM